MEQKLSISALTIVGDFMGKGKRFKEKVKNHKKRLLILALILIISIVMILYLKNKNIINKDEAFKNIANDNSQIQAGNTENAKTERMALLEDLQKQNSDIVGWLQIENTNINYPVLQGKDNDFYMTHDYKKEYSKEGSLFLDKDYDWTLPSTNLLIYGHNNRGTNEMFTGLINYKDEDYYKNHKTIRFTTNEEDAEYEIISVFLSRVYYKSETNVFRYYYFINAENEQEFNEYVQKSKAASLYDIEATAEYGDQLLTLSTCEFSQEDGRLAVVAKKIN